MKIIRQTFPITISLLSSLAISQAQTFNPGNLAILQVGNGGASLTSAGTAIFLDQYTTGGSFVNNFAIPSTGSGELVNSGSAASEGQLSLSGNGQYLVFAGYNAAAGTAGVAGASSSTVPRGIATMNASGNYSLAATTASFYSGNNIRGGTSDGSGNFWGAGPASSGGTVYLGTGTPAQISSVNSLVVQDIGGNLFYSTAKGTTGIYKIAGTPTSGTVTPTLVLTNAAPSDFTFNTSMTIAYVANTAGGIQRYDFSGGIWTSSYTLDSGTGMNGLAVNFSGTDPLIYATTEDGKNLIEITDSGPGSAATTLASVDGSTEAFRGLDFTPQPAPEPSTLAMIGLGAATLLGFRRNRKS
jgi:PEP-CTERM motif